MPRTLKGLRADAGKTQAEIAKKLGINQATFNGMENLDKEMCAKLAKLYGVKKVEVVITE